MTDCVKELDLIMEFKMSSRKFSHVFENIYKKYEILDTSEPLELHAMGYAERIYDDDSNCENAEFDCDDGNYIFECKETTKEPENNYKCDSLLDTSSVNYKDNYYYRIKSVMDNSFFDTENNCFKYNDVNNVKNKRKSYSDRPTTHVPQAKRICVPQYNDKKKNIRSPTSTLKLANILEINSSEDSETNDSANWSFTSNISSASNKCDVNNVTRTIVNDTLSDSSTAANNACNQQCKSFQQRRERSFNRKSNSNTAVCVYHKQVNELTCDSTPRLTMHCLQDFRCNKYHETFPSNLRRNLSNHKDYADVSSGIGTLSICSKEDSRYNGAPRPFNERFNLDSGKTSKNSINLPHLPQKSIIRHEKNTTFSKSFTNDNLNYSNDMASDYECNLKNNCKSLKNTSIKFRESNKKNKLTTNSDTSSLDMILESTRNLRSTCNNNHLQLSINETQIIHVFPCSIPDDSNNQEKFSCFRFNINKNKNTYSRKKNSFFQEISSDHSKNEIISYKNRDHIIIYLKNGKRTARVCDKKDPELNSLTDKKINNEPFTRDKKEWPNTTSMIHAMSNSKRKPHRNVLYLRSRIIVYTMII